MSCFAGSLVTTISRGALTCFLPSLYLSSFAYGAVQERNTAQTNERKNEALAISCKSDVSSLNAKVWWLVAEVILCACMQLPGGLHVVGSVELKQAKGMV